MPATPFAFDKLNSGLNSENSPVDGNPKDAADTLNVHYKSGGSIQMPRAGLTALIENPPWARKIADFEAGETWVGGIADTAVFFEKEAEAAGLQSMTLQVGSGDTGAMSRYVGGVNILGDPGAERDDSWFNSGADGEQPTNFFATRNVGVSTRETAIVHGGSNSIHAFHFDHGSSGDYLSVSGNLINADRPIAAGQTINFSCWVRVPSGQLNDGLLHLQIDATFDDAFLTLEAGNIWNPVDINVGIPLAPIVTVDDWVLVSYSFTTSHASFAGTGQPLLGWLIYSTRPAGGIGQAYFDDFSFAIQAAGLTALGDAFRDRYICFRWQWGPVGGLRADANFSIKLRFDSGVDYFETTIDSAHLWADNSGFDWNYSAIRMDAFTEPINSVASWDSISRITITVVNAGATDVKVWFDNLYQGPAAVSWLAELRRSPTFGSDKFLYAYAEEAIYVADFAAGRWALLVPGLTRTTSTGPIGHSVTYSERIWFCNGADRPVQLLNNTQWFFMSPTPPTVDLLAASLGIGNVVLPGDYEWVFTWFNAVTGRESAPKELTGGVTVAGTAGNLRFTITRSEDPIDNEGATHWIVYRRDPGSTVFYRTGDPAVGETFGSSLASYIPVAAKTITDDIPSTALGLELLTADYLPVPILSTIAELDDSLHGIGSGTSAGTAFWSIPGVPEAWGLAGFQVLGQGGTAPIMALIPFASRIWAGRDDEWHEGIKVQGGDWQYGNRSVINGAVSQASTNRCETLVRYVGEDGAYELTGDGFGRKISALIKTFWASLRYRSRLSTGLYQSDEERWLVGIGTRGTPYNDRLLTYSQHYRAQDLQGRPVGAWEVHDYETFAMTLVEDDDHVGMPVAAIPGGLVCQLFKGQTDLGRMISAVHETSWLDFGNSSVDKSLDGLDIDFGPVDPAVSLRMMLFLDLIGGTIAHDSRRTPVTSGGFSSFPITFGPDGGFLRMRGPRIGRFRRIKLRIEYSGPHGGAEIGLIRFFVRGKSIRVRR